MLETCPRCGAEWKDAIAMNGGPSEFFKECSNPKCNTFYNTYVPQAHQHAFHQDPHKFSGNFGGFGSGKTLTSREEIYKHVFITPNGNTLIGANVASQYEQTIKREIEADLPAAFIQRINTQKSYYDLRNNHRIMYRPYDDPDKLRSYNLTSFLIMEASEVKQQSFVQLKTRARNLAATISSGEFRTAANGARIPVIEHDWIKGVIESNPSAGWIRDDVLMNSSLIEKHGEVVDEYTVDSDRADPAISTHVTSTSANEFLPKDFIENNTKNKPLWWTNRYIYGSFLYAEGLVYPSATHHNIDDFEIPLEWKRIIAFDYGLSDDAVFLFGAVDQKEGLLYIYKELRTKDKNVEELAKMFKQACEDIPVGGLICSPLIDPKSGYKRDFDKKTLADHFLDFGISFAPGFVNVDARVFRLNTYLESGKLKIFRSCKGLRHELENYKYSADESMANGFTGKPVDKNNHGVNALEWITMELPSDPKNLLYGVYNKAGDDITKLKNDEEKKAYWALSDDEDEFKTNRLLPFDADVDYNYM